MEIVWQLTIVHFSSGKSKVQGLLLKNSRNPKPSSRYFGNSLSIVDAYRAKAVANKTIRVAYDSGAKVTTTTKDGSFEVWIDTWIKQPTLHDNRTGAPLSIVQQYPTLFQAPESAYEIISDIDDTITFSYTKNAIKRIRTILFTLPEKRKTISATQEIFKQLLADKSRVFYVSRSESNLFHLLGNIIMQHKLPLGVLCLTQHQFWRKMWRKAKKENHKTTAIQEIIINSPDKQFYLLGDDSQHDMAVYRDIILAYPDRILEVFIRQTQNHRSLRQSAAFKQLEATGIKATYF